MICTCIGTSVALLTRSSGTNSFGKLSRHTLRCERSHGLMNPRQPPRRPWSQGTLRPPQQNLANRSGLRGATGAESQGTSSRTVSGRRRSSPATAVGARGTSKVCVLRSVGLEVEGRPRTRTMPRKKSRRQSQGQPLQGLWPRSQPQQIGLTQSRLVMSLQIRS